MLETIKNVALFSSAGIDILALIIACFILFKKITRKIKLKRVQRTALEKAQAQEEKIKDELYKGYLEKERKKNA